ncbi:MAG: response regulator [Bacteroidota bacterium]
MKKILVIEDNEEVRENLAEILELSNYEVTTANNGKQGAQMAIDGQPDLIICDIMMPELDGYGVLRVLGRRPDTASIPFIFLSAKSENEDFRKGMALGADDYITKPFNDVDLLDAIEIRLRKRERLRQRANTGEGSLRSFLDEVKGSKAFQELSEKQEERIYHKRDLIYEENTYPRQVYQIVKGKVKLYKTSENGKELIVDILKEGNFFGFISVIKNSKYTETAAALEECRLRMIPKKDFIALLSSDMNVAAQLIKLLANNILEKEEQLLNMAYNSVRKRISEALIQLYEHYREGDQAVFSILRDDLANMAGTTKETVIRTLTEFKEDKLIEVKGHKILIIDKSGLENLPY